MLCLGPQEKQAPSAKAGVILDGQKDDDDDDDLIVVLPPARPRSPAPLWLWRSGASLARIPRALARGLGRADGVYGLIRTGSIDCADGAFDWVRHD